VITNKIKIIDNQSILEIELLLFIIPINKRLYLDTKMDTKEYNKYAQELREEGYVIIPEVFSTKECNEWCNSIASSLCQISPDLNIDINNGTVEAWYPKDLPPGPRSGLFQSLVSTFPAVLQIRSHPKICQIFREIYSYLRGKEIRKFFTSMDGINVRPPVAPFYTKKSKDWAHLDQTFKGVEHCVQGQVVLSDTTACLKVSSRSHLIHDKIIDKYNIKDYWYKIPEENKDEIEDMVNEEGGLWQQPIVAPRGSVILWFSTTIHSARVQLPEDALRPKLLDNIFNGWRFVVYVCHRPKEDIKNRKTHSKRLRKCLKECRVTNHEGQRLFPKKVFYDRTIRNSVLEEYVNNPEKMLEILDIKKELEAIEHLVSE
jgi:hypothetical protein